MKISQIAEIIEKIAPVEIAEEWDNVGLLIGNRDKEVSKVLVALDINPNIIKQAIECGADLIITHHPIIFKPLSKIVNDSLLKLLDNKIAVYSAHTNLDNAIDGVNKVLSDVLKLKNVQRHGMLAVGEVKECSVSEFVDQVKDNLSVTNLRCSAVQDKKISKVAVLGGSGGDFVTLVSELGCDAFVTGEASYHDAQLAYENNLLLISAGHFETENPVIDFLCNLIKQNANVEVIKAKPFNVYINR